jgi:2-hydroxychromene-2-carboxylate isomerase
MSIRTLLTPMISARLLGESRLMRLRARAEHRRVRQGAAHQVHVFHQVDDPYSALVAQCLPAFAARYAVHCVPHLVPPAADSAAPDRPRLVAWSRRDAVLLAERLGLHFRDRGRQPNPEAVRATQRNLLGALKAGQFIEAAAPLSQALWDSVATAETGSADEALAEVDLVSIVPATETALSAHLAESAALRERLGHYLGATFYYAGEWYWGLDRLHHLEARLRALGLDRTGGPDLAPAARDRSVPVPLSDAAEIEFFFSLRSPYSAIVAPRVFELARLSGATVKLRYLLPMVMRGLPVPAAKRRYISLDAAREARLHGVPFGRLNDPVGRPTERGLALMPLAERYGAGQAYVLSFMQGVWAEGLDAGSDRGLRRIAERARLNWDEAREALRDDRWRTHAEHHRAALLEAGLWGVPAFRVGDTAVWGQDRLWVIDSCLTGSHPTDHAREGMPSHPPQHRGT